MTLSDCTSPSYGPVTSVVFWNLATTLIVVSPSVARLVLSGICTINSIFSFLIVVSVVTLLFSTCIDFMATGTVDLFFIVKVYSIWSPGWWNVAVSDASGWYLVSQVLPEKVILPVGAVAPVIPAFAV